MVPAPVSTKCLQGVAIGNSDRRPYGKIFGVCASTYAHNYSFSTGVDFFNTRCQAPPDVAGPFAGTARFLLGTRVLIEYAPLPG